MTPTRAKYSNNNRFLIRNHGGKKEVVHYFSSAGRKELSTQNSIPRKKYPLGMKGKLIHSKTKEN